MNNKFCMYCGNKMKPDGSYCTECGNDNNVAEIGKMFLVHCGIKIPSDATYCPNCGREIGAKNSDLEQYQAEAEVTGRIQENAEGMGEDMNVGNKIRMVAKVFFFVDILLSFLIAYLVYGAFERDESKAILLAICVVAVLIALGWVIYLCLCGYGQLINDQRKILEELYKSNKKK